MAIYHDIDQRSIQWFKLRMGIPTASGLADLLKLDFTRRDGELPKTYLFKRLAEKISGNPLIGGGSRATEQGQMLEDEAVRWFEMEHEKTQCGGFVTTDDGRMGCSPDGLIGDDSGIEIKCPNPETHVRYLVEGKLPNDYVHQVHGSIYVTGRKTWRFLSYHRGLPPFLLTIERDEQKCALIAEAIEWFHGQFKSMLSKIENL